MSYSINWPWRSFDDVIMTLPKLPSAVTCDSRIGAVGDLFAVA